MPETPVNEDAGSIFGQNNVGTYPTNFLVKAESEAVGVKNFRTRIFGFVFFEGMEAIIRLLVFFVTTSIINIIR